MDTLPVYAKRSQRMVITARRFTIFLQKLIYVYFICYNCLCTLLCLTAPITNAPVVPKALIAGQKRTHPTYIPSHFPEFPDPHAYIKTPVSYFAHLMPCNCVTFSLTNYNIKNIHPASKYNISYFCVLDLSRACVRVPGGEREGGIAEERCGTCSHTLHGQDRRDGKPF